MSAAGTSTVSGSNERISGCVLDLITEMITTDKLFGISSLLIYCVLCSDSTFNCLSAAVNLRSSR